MKQNEINSGPLEIFLRCSACNNFILYNSEMCEYCGSVIFYDDEKQQYYISGRICFKCGFENNIESSHCLHCKSKFSIVCPKCKYEVDITETNCKRCGLCLDKFYIVNKENERLGLMETDRSERIGLYIGGFISLIAALFFTYLSLSVGIMDIKRTAFIMGAAIFYVLFIAVVRSMKKGHEKKNSAATLSYSITDGEHDKRKE